MFGEIKIYALLGATSNYRSRLNPAVPIGLNLLLNNIVLLGDYTATALKLDH